MENRERLIQWSQPTLILLNILMSNDACGDTDKLG